MRSELKKYRTSEFVPPPPTLVLVEPNFLKTVEGYTSFLVDSTTVEGQRLTTVDSEPTSIYFEYARRYEHLLLEANSFIGIWTGDNKLYLAVTYGFESDPFYVSSNPNYIKITTNLQDSNDGKQI